MKGINRYILGTFCAAFLFMLHPAPAHACTSPAGTGGDMFFSEDENVPVYCDGTDWIAMIGSDPDTGGNYVPNAVYFDGAGDGIEYSSALTGVTDTKMVTGSLWIKDPNPGSFKNIFKVGTNSGSTGDLNINIGGSDQFRLYGFNASAGLILDMDTPNATNDGNWIHLLFSFDLSDVNNRHIYVNGVDSFDAAAVYTDDFLDVTGTHNRSSESGSEMELADVWLDFGTYIDLSVQANREMFYNAGPVYLGGDGSLPTGSAPDIFLSGDTANWHTNKGTGGGFTENGALTDAATSPTGGTQIVPSGLIGHWRLDETTGTTAFDSTTNSNDGTMNGGLSGSDSTIGAIDAALLFDGNDDYIEITSTPFVDAADQPFAFSIWSRASISDLRGFLISSGDGAAPNYSGISLNMDATNSIVRVETTGGFHRQDPIPSNYKPSGWNHFVVQNNGSNIEAYVNGERVINWSPASSINPYFSNGFFIGAANSLNSILMPNRHFDDIRLYNRMLTEDEITELYNARDGIRYNDARRTMEFFDGNQWVSMTLDWPEVDQGANTTFTADATCTNIGDVCSDGSVYAGLSPDTNRPMYTTPNDAGSFTWNNGNSGAGSWAETSADNCTTAYLGGGACSTGLSNSNIIALEDSDDAVAGSQPHAAILECFNLSAHGHDDWYLPASDELYVLYTNRVAIGNFDTTTGSWDSTYWSSSEHAASHARTIGFDDSIEAQIQKQVSMKVRCVTYKDSLTASVNSGGLVAHWKLDETEGTTAVDSTGSNDGTMQNGLDASNESVPGAVGGALEFMDVLDDSITVPYNASFDPTNPTLAGWVKLTSSNPNTILFGRRLGTSDPFNSFVIRVSGLTVGCSASTGLSGSQVNSSLFGLNENEWYHLACTYDGTSTYFYVNGNLEFTTTFAGPIGYNTTDFQIGDDLTGASGDINAILDDLRFYNRVLTDSEITQLYQMGAPVGSSTALPANCPNPGDVCDDGSIYAGLSPDGNVAMYTTPADGPLGLSWNNANINNKVNLTLADCSTGWPSADPECIEGENNTNLIITEDADSGTAGFQPHQVAQYCYDLVAHGADDWYLPSQDEVRGNFFPNVTAIGGFNTTTETYWTSSERDAGDAITIFLGNGGGSWQGKQDTVHPFRCVRKGPAPRCANPYGMEGDVFYNTTHNVVQFCDGARWMGIGKVN